MSSHIYKPQNLWVLSLAESQTDALPNSECSRHVLADADPPTEGLETWFIRGGSAGAALYTFRQPGLYAYVSHNLIEAVELGALAHVSVDGTWNDDLMTQVRPPEPIPA